MCTILYYTTSLAPRLYAMAMAAGLLVVLEESMNAAAPVLLKQQAATSMDDLCCFAPKLNQFQQAPVSPGKANKLRDAVRLLK
jgi:hypothetical protein